MEPMQFHAMIKTQVNGHDRYREVAKYYASRDEAHRRRRERMRRVVGWLRAPHGLEHTDIRATQPVADQA